MNPDTRTVVCCYAGDQHQVIKALGQYLHHKCPVVILSPEDSKAEIRYPGIENRFGGKRAYIGQESLDRQREHMRLMLTFPEHHFLVHDADSVCLSPEIPGYLYAERGVLWSNVVNDGIPEHQPAYPAGFPHIAFQPPYFMDRETIEGLLAVSEGMKANPTMPFIDHYMVQLALKANWPYRSFRDGISCPIGPEWPNEFALVRDAVRSRGAIFLHSIKKAETLAILCGDRKEYARTHP
jgi:hypothetical protein